MPTKSLNANRSRFLALGLGLLVALSACTSQTSTTPTESFPSAAQSQPTAAVAIAQPTSPTLSMTTALPTATVAATATALATNTTAPTPTPTVLPTATPVPTQPQASLQGVTACIPPQEPQQATVTRIVDGEAAPPFAPPQRRSVFFTCFLRHPGAGVCIIPHKSRGQQGQRFSHRARPPRRLQTQESRLSSPKLEGNTMARRRRSTIGRVRGGLYRSARILGNVQAAAKGPKAVAKRVARRKTRGLLWRLFH